VACVLQHFADRCELHLVDQPRPGEEILRELYGHLVDLGIGRHLPVDPCVLEVAARDEHHLPVADGRYVVAHDAPCAARPRYVVELAFAVDMDREIETPLAPLEDDERVLRRYGRDLGERIAVRHGFDDVMRSMRRMSSMHMRPL
jgi:hypothetical protein